MLIVIIISTCHCGTFENMMSFSPILNQDLEQGKLMATVPNRYLGKTYCVRKCKQMGIENLIIVAL